MKAILLALLLLVCSGVYSQDSEVLIVEEIYQIGEEDGIYIFRTGQEPERIETKGVSAKGSRVVNGKILHVTFTKLYQEGWHLVGTTGTLYTGRFIFEREKQ